MLALRPLLDSQNVPGIQEVQQVRSLPSLQKVPMKEKEQRHLHHENKQLANVAGRFVGRYIQQGQRVQEHQRHHLYQEHPANRNIS